MKHGWSAEYLNNCTKTEVGTPLRLNSQSVVSVCTWPIKCSLISWWTGGCSRHPKGSLGLRWITCREAQAGQRHTEEEGHWSIIPALGDSSAEYHRWREWSSRKQGLSLAPQPGQGQDGSPGQPWLWAPPAHCFSWVHTFDLRTGSYQNYTALRKWSYSISF